MLNEVQKNIPESQEELSRMKQLDVLEPREIVLAIDSFDNTIGKLLTSEKEVQGKGKQQEAASSEGNPKQAGETPGIKNVEAQATPTKAPLSEKSAENTSKLKTQEAKNQPEVLESELPSPDMLFRLTGKTEQQLIKEKWLPLNLSINDGYNLGSNAEGFNVNTKGGVYVLRGATDAGLFSMGTAIEGRTHVTDTAIGKLFIHGKVGIGMMDKIISEEHSIDYAVSGGGIVELQTPIEFAGMKLGSYLGLQKRSGKGNGIEYGMFFGNASDPKAKFLYTVVVGGEYNTRQENVYEGLGEKTSSRSMLPFNNIKGMATYMFDDERQLQAMVMANDLIAPWLRKKDTLLSPSQQIEAMMDLRALYRLNNNMLIHIGTSFGHIDGALQVQQVQAGVKIKL